MIWDFTWFNDPSAWFGLGTLIVLEIVLGIDNIVFISILSSRLPAEQKQRAFTIGLSLALAMRLLLLFAIAWIVSLTKPWLSFWGYTLSARDIILIVGGLFLLFKGTMELHERLEGHAAHAEKPEHPPVFWHVIVQIVVLDAIFSLDSVITSVGMVKELPVMMIAVIVAMICMLVAARPLTAFVDRHPSVIVLCLGFLLMIGLSLIMDGAGLHIPKGYLYAAISFSILVEAFNQVALRKRRNRLTPQTMRDSAAKAVLQLLGGGTTGATSLDVAALASKATNGEIFAPEECTMVARVIRLGGRTVRYIMTPRRRMICLNENTDRSEIMRTVAESSYACLPVLRHNTDEVLGVVHVGDLLKYSAHDLPELAALVRPVPSVLEQTPLHDVLETFRAHPVPLVLVKDEYGSVVGMVTPEDMLHAIAGHMGDSTITDEGFKQPDGSWNLSGRLSVDDLSHMLGENLTTEAATLAGVILEKCGHIPVQGEQGTWHNWRWEILHMDGLRIARVRFSPCKRVTSPSAHEQAWFAPQPASAHRVEYRAKS